MWNHTVGDLGAEGNARARMLPDNLDHLRVEWMKRSTYNTAWVTPGHDCPCPYQFGHGAAVRLQTNNTIWDGVIGLWSRVAPLLSQLLCKRECANGSELEPVLRFKIMFPWHSDNESLFGPPNQPKPTVSVSLGHSWCFRVLAHRVMCLFNYAGPW